jgi:four helix bundle protein
MAKGYKSVDVYQSAHRLAVEVHQMTLRELPKFEMYEEGSQVRRSSKSIPSNFVEGYGRRFYKADFLRFLTYALASCDETKEHLELLKDTGSLAKVRGEYFIREYEQVGRELYRFIQSVSEQHQAGFPQAQSRNSTVHESQITYVTTDVDDWQTWLHEYAPEEWVNDAKSTVQDAGGKMTDAGGTES